MSSGVRDQSITSLYGLPAVYEAARKPSPEQARSLLDLAEQILGRRPKAIADPACGPGTWLHAVAPFVENVAGNDLSPQMVAHARVRLASFDAELVVSDMRTLEFQTAPFDVLMEMGGTLFTLPDHDIERTLESWAAVVRPSGILMLTVFPRPDEYTRSVPRTVWLSERIDAGGHNCVTVRYDVVDVSDDGDEETLIRTTALEDDGTSPELLTERYTVRLVDDAYVERIAAALSLRYAGVYIESGYTWVSTRMSDAADHEEALLVLQAP